MTRFPPFELQGRRETLALLTADIAGYAIQDSGRAHYAAWFRTGSGQAIFLSADQRDLQPMFEVFALQAASLEDLHIAWRDWRPKPVPPDMPETWRLLWTTRPPEPTAPASFRPWPFATWRTEVLRRVEFLETENSPPTTFGDYAYTQAAARPSTVPPEASVSCEVVAGLLFTGSSGGRLLIGVDWMPTMLTVTESPEEIEGYLTHCEADDLLSYLEQRADPG